MYREIPEFASKFGKACHSVFEKSLGKYNARLTHCKGFKTWDQLDLA